MWKWAWLLLLLTASAACFAQYQDTVWTVRGNVVLDDHFRKWKPDVVLDARTSTLNGERVRVGGVRLGAEYRRVHRFGLGIYSAATQLYISDDPNDNSVLDSARFNLNYASAYYERVLLLLPKWEWSASAHLGVGNVAVTYGAQNVNTVDLRDRIRVNPLEWSTSGYYHFTYWLSAGGGVGYRQILNAPREVRQAYQGYIYVIKLKIKVIKLVRSIWNPNVRYEY